MFQEPIVSSRWKIRLLKQEHSGKCTLAYRGKTVGDGREGGKPRLQSSTQGFSKHFRKLLDRPTEEFDTRESPSFRSRTGVFCHLYFIFCFFVLTIVRCSGAIFVSSRVCGSILCVCIYKAPFSPPAQVTCVNGCACGCMCLKSHFFVFHLPWTRRKRQTSCVYASDGTQQPVH